MTDNLANKPEQPPVPQNATAAGNHHIHTQPAQPASSAHPSASLEPTYSATSGDSAASSVTPRKKLSGGAIAAISVGAIIAVVTVGGFAIAATVTAAGGSTGAGPQEVVATYLDALKDADAETAQSVLDTYGDTSLLTDEVLEESNTRAQISKIEVGEVTYDDEYDATVSVDFALGTQKVERTFDLYKYSEGWKISDGLISMPAAALFADLNLTINGADAPDETAYVFPGTYELAVGRTEFGIAGDETTFTLATSDDAESLYTLEPELSDAGAQEFQTLVTAAVEQCLAETTLNTACGADVSALPLEGDFTPVENTVTRTLSASDRKKLENLEPRLDYDSPTLVTSSALMAVQVTLQGTKDGQTGQFTSTFGIYFGIPSVDFNTDQPTVTWTSTTDLIQVGHVSSDASNSSDEGFVK